MKLQWIQNPILDFTTYAEYGSGPVNIYLDEILAGTVDLHGAPADYVMEISDSVLTQVGWNLGYDLDLDIRFEFVSDEGWFQLSTDYDWFQDTAFSEQFDHYGLGITTILGQGTPPIPEPTTVALVGVALGGLLVARKRRSRA